MALKARLCPFEARGGSMPALRPGQTAAVAAAPGRLPFEDPSGPAHATVCSAG